MIFFKEVGPTTVEFKFRMKNEKVDVVVHNVAKVKDNKFIASEPVDGDSFRYVSHIRDAYETYKSEVRVSDKLKADESEWIDIISTEQ